MSKKLLLLGGGHAHVHVLQALAQETLAGAQVTLVTPYGRQMYSGMVPGLVAGHYKAEACAIALQPLAAAAQVRFIEGAAKTLDSTARQVTLVDGQVLGYDVLSVDTGAVMDRDRLPGAREHGLFVRPIEHFVRLLDGLWDLAARRVLDLVVVGGGAAGVELALALHHRLNGHGEERARVVLVTGGGEPLAGYPQGVVTRAARTLAQHRIAVFRDSCAALKPGALVLGSGARLACDAPVLATGAEAPQWLQGCGLQLDVRGFVVTGPNLQSTSHPEVFAAGDVASRADAPHAKSGVYAVRAGPALALNLRRFVAGGALEPHRPQSRTLNLISCGERKAIVAWGHWSAQGRWAWWWKDRIDRAFVARYTLPASAGAQPIRSA
jgi:pyridine nucleotide-disulfide oxidoreductase family protein